MRIRNRHGSMGHSSRFNPVGIGEVIVIYDDDDMCSEFIGDCDIRLRTGEWVPLGDALRLHLVVPDYCDRTFREPLYFDEMDRGWF